MAVVPLPGSQSAILDLGKLADYCLNPDHARGRHKARVFREALGIDRRDAAWLREVLLTAVREEAAAELPSDIFGTRWRVDVPVRRQERRAVIRTVWIVRSGEGVPRFVTCWVL
jgi:hypothetical protein